MPGCPDGWPGVLNDTSFGHIKIWAFLGIPLDLKKFSGILRMLKKKKIMNFKASGQPATNGHY